MTKILGILFAGILTILAGYLSLRVPSRGFSPREGAQKLFFFRGESLWGVLASTSLVLLIFALILRSFSATEFASVYTSPKFWPTCVWVLVALVLLTRILVVWKVVGWVVLLSTGYFVFRRPIESSEPTVISRQPVAEAHTTKKQPDGRRSISDVQPPPRSATLIGSRTGEAAADSHHATLARSLPQKAGQVDLAGWAPSETSRQLLGRVSVSVVAPESGLALSAVTGRRLSELGASVSYQVRTDSALPAQCQIRYVAADYEAAIVIRGELGDLIRCELEPVAGSLKLEVLLVGGK